MIIKWESRFDRKIVQEIRRYLEDEEPLNLNQWLLDMDNLFWGIVIKIWEDNPIEECFGKFSKIMIKHYMLFYCKSWI